MTSMLPPVVLEIISRSTGLKHGLAEATGDLDKFESKSKAAFARTAAVGKVALEGIAVGGLAAGAASLKLGINFEDSTTKLVTGAGESEAALGKVRKGLLDLAPAVGQTPQQLSSGMYLVESAGYHAAAGLTVLKAAAQGAKVGGADLRVVSDGLTTALTDYHLKAGDAATVTSQLVKTVASGKTTMQDLAGSLHNVLPSAAAAHIGLSQVLGGMSTMTAQGISADQASQDLANTIRSLQNPTQKQAETMAALGLKSGKVAAELGKRGLTGTMDELVAAITNKMGPSGQVLLDTFKNSSEEAAKARTELANLPPSLQSVAAEYLKGSITQKEWRKSTMGMSVDQRQLAQEFAATVNRSRGFNELLTKGGPAAKTFAGTLADLTGGATGMNTALALAGPNSKVFNANVAAISKTTADAKGNVQGFSLTQKDLKFKLAEAKAGVEALGTKFGMWLIPKVDQAIIVTQKIVGWFGRHKTVAEVLGIAVGTVLAGAIGAYIASLLVAVATSSWGFAKMIAQGVMWVATQSAGFATVAAEAIVSFISMGVAALAWAAEMLVAGAMALLPFLPIILAVGALIAVGYLLVTHWKQIWGFVERVVKDAVGWIKEHWSLILAILTGPIGLAVRWVIQHWDQVVGYFQDAVGWIKSHWTLILAILTGPIGLAIRWIVQHWDGIIDYFKGVPGRITKLASGMWDGIKDAFRAAIDWLISAWNSLHFSIHIPSVHVGPVHIGGGDIGFGVPQIPLLQYGGHIFQGGMAIVGDHGPELLNLGSGASVYPLNGSDMPAGAGGGGPLTIEVPISIDGRAFARATVTYTRAELLRMNRNLPNLGLS